MTRTSQSATADPTSEVLSAVEALPADECARQILALAATANLNGLETAQQLGPAVRELEAAMNALHGLRLRVLAHAARAGVEREGGHTSTGAWLADLTHTSGAEAARAVRLAADLDALPDVGDVLTAGLIGVGHAHVIAQTHRDLSPGLDDLERELVINTLVDRAHSMPVAQLRSDARRVLEIVHRRQSEVDQAENQTLADQEAAALARTRLRMHDNDDGTVTGRFTIPSYAATILTTAVQQITAPRRQAFRTTCTDTTTTARGGEGDTRGMAAATSGRGPDRDPDQAGSVVDWAHLQGLALVELLEHLPTDRLHHTVPATVVVTMSLDTLRDQLAAAGTDTDLVLSAGQARQIACQTGIIPAVLGGSSVPLDLGRSRRFFTDSQRAALAVAYTQCAAVGCDRPYAWCEHHHQDPWAKGGTTNLDRAVPLCWAHHRLIHSTGYTSLIHDLDDGTKRVLFRQRNPTSTTQPPDN